MNPKFSGRFGSDFQVGSIFTWSSCLYLNLLDPTSAEFTLKIIVVVADLFEIVYFVQRKVFFWAVGALGGWVGEGGGGGISS